MQPDNQDVLTEVNYAAQSSQYHLLSAILVFLTVVGNAVKVAAYPIDLSSSSWKTVGTSQPPLTDNGSLSQLPNPIPPRTPEPSIEPPTELEEPRLEAPPAQPVPSLREEIPGTIEVARFEFVGNTAFSDEELSKVVASFTGREITFAELIQAEEAVTELYISNGYINSGAVIPAGQTFSLEGAVVTIQIIEGGIEDIQVTGTRRLNPNYVRSRLAIATQTPLNRDRLLKALQMLQLDPLLESISAELSAGARPNSSLLSVRIQEADSFNIELFADNARVPSIGSFERGIRFNQANLLGFGDGLSVEWANTDGSNALYTTYTIPVNPYNGAIKFSATINNTEVIEPPFDRLDILGDSRYFDLSFRQPLIQTPSQEFALGLTASREESETELLGEGFPLSPGADDDGQTRISALRFFQEWTQRSLLDVFAVRSQFSLGLGAFDATINDEPPDSQFFLWRGQGQYVRLLFPDSLLVVRSDLQLSTRALVPLEQFTLGGLYSVRGYRQDALVTDNGIFASAEVRLPILRVESVEGVLQVGPFLDCGIGWNDADNPVPTPDPNTLVGVGLGLQWQMGNNFTARFDWGIPLTDVEDGDRTWQENGFYFSINYSPF